MPDTQQQPWNPVEEARKNYPALKDWSDDRILKNLSDPTKFKAAFPQYSHLGDDVIKRNISLLSKPTDSALTRFRKGEFSTLKDAAKGIVSFLDPRPSEDEKQRGLTTPYDTIMRYPERLVGPNADLMTRATEEAKSGHYVDAAAHGAASLVPMLGPWAVQIGEKSGQQAAEGNWAGAAGTLAGNAMLYESAKPIEKVGGKVAQKGVAAIKELKRVAEETHLNNIKAAQEHLESVRQAQKAAEDAKFTQRKANAQELTYNPATNSYTEGQNLLPSGEAPTPAQAPIEAPPSVQPEAPAPDKYGAYSRHTEDVPVDELAKFAEANRTLNPKGDMEKLKGDIQANGIREPLVLSYDQKSGKAGLSEGNTRLQIAKELGLKTVPVRVLRTDGRGGKAKVGPYSGPETDYHGAPRVPGDLRPSHIGVKTASPHYEEKTVVPAQPEKGVQEVKLPTVQGEQPASTVRARTNVLQRNTAGEVRQAAGQAPTVWLSPTAWKSFMGTLAPGEDAAAVHGVNLPADHHLLADSDMARGDVYKLLAEANKNVGGGGAAVAAARPSVQANVRVMREELNHTWQRSLSGDSQFRNHLTPEAFSELHAAIPKGMQDHLVDQGYNSESAPEMVTETAAKLMDGRPERFGVTNEEATSFLDNYFKQVTKQHGAKALEALHHVRGVAADAKARTIAEHSGTERGQGNATVPSVAAGRQGGAGQGVSNAAGSQGKVGEVSDWGNALFSRDKPLWYLKSDRLVGEKMRGPQPAEDVQKMLIAGGVKPDEMQWTGLTDFLKSKGKAKVTPEEIREHLANNNLQIKEVTKGGLKNWTQEDSARLDELENNRDLTDEEEVERQQLIDRENASGDHFGTPEVTKYSSYVLPGGENYREMLLTMPQRMVDSPTARSITYSLPGKEPAGAGAIPQPASLEHIQQMRDRGFTVNDLGPEKIASTEGNFKSGHWEEPNILAHVRYNDRTVPARTDIDIPDVEQRIMKAVGVTDAKSLGSGAPIAALRKGVIDEAEAAAYSKHKGYHNPELNAKADKRLLHLEEIQSDWHQKGREKGYADSEALRAAKTEYENAKLEMDRAHKKAKYAELRAVDPSLSVGERNIAHREYQDANDQARKLREKTYEAQDKLDNISKSDVPDAPFKKNWHEMALRRMLKHAVENGYDALSWTGGAEQAERYDLSKQIESVSFTPADAESSTGWLTATDKNGNRVIDEEIESEQLPDYVGKEAAHKLMDKVKEWRNDAETNYSIRERDEDDEDIGRFPYYIEDYYGEPVYTYAGDLEAFSSQDDAAEWIEEKQKESMSQLPVPELKGLDLKVGGEGMHGFYDKIVPDYLNKFGKKWGAKVGTTEIPVTEEWAGNQRGITASITSDQRFGKMDLYATVDSSGNWTGITGDSYERYHLPQGETLVHVATADGKLTKEVEKLEKAKTNGKTVPYLPITEEMRKSIKEEGVPLFNREKGKGGEESEPDETQMDIHREAGKKLREAREKYSVNDEESIKAYNEAHDHYMMSSPMMMRKFMREQMGNTKIGDLKDVDELERMFAQQQKPTDTPEFKKWFGDSKIVDKEGEPLRVYHGTTKDFDTFKGETDHGVGKGNVPAVNFFSPQPRYANSFTNDMRGNEEGGRIMPVYIKMENPFHTDHQPDVEQANLHISDNAIADLKKEGFDGIIYSKKGDITKGPTGWGDDSPQYVTFYPNQIKSAIGNRGTFDPKDPNILMSREKPERSYNVPIPDKTEKEPSPTPDEVKRSGQKEKTNPNEFKPSPELLRMREAYLRTQDKSSVKAWHEGKATIKVPQQTAAHTRLFRQLKDKYKEEFGSDEHGQGLIDFIQEGDTAPSKKESPRELLAMARNLQGVPR